MGRITILGGVGGSGSGGSPTPPNQVTLGTPTIRFTLPDNQGKTYVEIFVPFTPPTPVGTFAGVMVYLQAPDNIPASAAGNATTIGDQGFIIAADESEASFAGSMVPVGQLTDLGKIPYDPNNLILAVGGTVPTQAEEWRLYALAYSPDVTPQLVTADQPSPTPNITFTVDPNAPPTLGASGAEFSPNAVSFTSPDGAAVLTNGDGITYSTDQVGGGQFYSISAVWTNATSDPRFNQLGHYNILIVGPDGSNRLAASPAPTDLQFVSSPPWVVPSSPQTYTLYLLSVDINGNPNTLIPGLTPSVTYTVGVQFGPAGAEFAPMAPSFTAPSGASVLTSDDGILYSANQVGQFYTLNGIWTNPTSDPRFSQLGSYDVIIVYPDGSQHLTANPSPQDLQFHTAPPWVVPSPAVTYTIYLVSVDTSGQTNSIVPGVTPSVTVTVGAELGPPGEEYVDLITDLVANLPGFTTNGAGQKDFPVVATFQPPTDPNFAGVVFHFIYAPIVITSVTNTNPVQFTFGTPHTVSPGGNVNIGYTGITSPWDAVIGSWPATIISPTVLTIPVDSTTFGSATGTYYGSPDITLTGVQPTSPCQIDVFHFPASSQTITLYALSVGADGSTNTYVPGVTPSDPVTLVPPPSGGAGTEFTVCVTSFLDSIAYSISGDGTETWAYKCSWTNPLLTSHPEFAGVKLVLRNSLGTIPDTVLYAGPGDSSFQSPNWPVGATATYFLFAVSVDVNGKENSIQAGVTPVAGFVVSLQTTGNIRGDRVSTSTLHSSLSINSGLLGVAPGGVTTTQIADGSVSTPKLTTSEISVGFAGSSMPIRFRVYDHAGNPIAWIGDDTANSGLVGAWFKEMYVGGTGPSGAPMTVNASGQLAINLTSSTAGATAFSLNLNGVTATVANVFDSTLSDYVGLRIQNNSSSAQSVLTSSGVVLRDGSGNGLAALITPGNTAGELTLSNFATPGNEVIISPSGGYHVSLFNSSGASAVLSTTSLAIGGAIVVQGRQSGPGNPAFSFLSDAQTWCANLLTALRAHGLIT